MRKAHNLGDLQRVILGLVVIALSVAFGPATMRAELTRVEISDKRDVLSGKAFGSVGAYEILVGKAYFALDPNIARNKIIADLDKAPKNAQGKVEFSADIFILRPKDPSKANGVLLFDIPNRGGKGVFSAFNLGTGSRNPTTEADFGDAFIMRQGYTVVNVGWEFDTPRAQDMILLDAPVVTDNGKTITGWLPQGPWFIPDKKADSYNYAVGYFNPIYPPLNPSDPTYRMTVRDQLVAVPRLVPREDWQFGQMENGKLSTDVNWVTLKGGFQPGKVYQLNYESSNPRVAGAGFAALRDVASAMRYNADALVKGQYVYTYGASQTGRFQRQMVYEGFTIDEQGRKVVDAMIIHVAADSLGMFNERWAQESELGSYDQTKFPFRYEMTTDLLTGKRDGLGARIPAGMEPKIFSVDTESECYDRGRISVLRTLSMDGGTDLPDPPNVRYYTFAGAKHGAGTWPPNVLESQQNLNDPLDYRFMQKAELDALDNWVRKGIAPPPSQVPTVKDRTAVLQQDVKFPKVPGIQWPSQVPGGWRNDVMAGPKSVLPLMVPQVDADGNITSGVRLPEQSVPLGTYTGWAFRSEAYGSSNTLVSMAGSFIPFAKTKAERAKTGDPRLSIEERYASKDVFLKQVQDAANKLVSGRYLLLEDVDRIVKEAGQHWDWIMNVYKASQ
jgi:hypothetical protein